MNGTLRALLCGLAVACGTPAEPPVAVPSPDCKLVVVSSDYSSSSVSLLKADGSLCADNVLHSGSAPPGVTTALSGDVVPARTPDPAGRIVLIDRNNAVLTLFDPNTFQVTAQLSVATGFQSNPQDLLFVDEAGERAYVSRFASNQTARRQAYDAGDDVLVVNFGAGGGEIVGTVDLAPYAPSGYRPRPGALTRVGGYAFVMLANLSEDFLSAADSAIARLDPATDSVVDTAPIPGLTGCNEVVPAPDSNLLWAVCAGLFADSDTQLLRSGVAVIDASGSPQVVFSAPAGQLGLTRPLAFSLAAQSAEIAWVVTFGDTDGTRDELWRVDRTQGTAQAVGLVSGGFELGSPILSPDGSLVLIPDANAQNPALRRYDLTLGEFLTAEDVSPQTGLQPRAMAIFR